MTDDLYAPRPLAPWFKWAAWGSLLFMAFGCMSYLMNVTADRAALPVDQQAMMDAVPTWMWAAFAIAVWVGLAGAVLLVLRRRLAVPVLLVSLIATTAQFAGYFVVPALSEAMSSDALLIPIVILALCWTIFWFAYHSNKRGWLR